MATRFYLPSSGTAPITNVAFNAGWEDTSIGARLPTYTSKQNTAMSTVSFTDSDATNKDILFKQYVSEPLAAQVISAQTVTFVIRALEVGLGNNLFTTIDVRLVSNDGSVVRGTLVSMRRDGAETTTSLTARNNNTGNSTAITCHHGDRLIIEIGLGGYPAAGSDHDGSLRIGDNAASDLTAGDTDTDDDNPYVEFANNLTFWTAGDIIVHNVSSANVNTTTGTTHSHTVPTGLSNTALLVQFATYDPTPSDRQSPSLSYNGDALTALETYDQNPSGDGSVVGVYLLLNPDTGTNNLSVTLPGTVDNYSLVIYTLSGVKQSGQPDATAEATKGASSPWSLDITTVADRCLIFNAGDIGDSQAFTTGQLFVASFYTGYHYYGYYGPKTPAGSYTWGETSNTDDGPFVLVSIAPVPSGTAYDTTLTEAIVLVDAIVRGPTKILSDVVTIVDVRIHDISRVLTDVVTVVDTVLKTPGRLLEEVIVIVDTILNQAGKMLIEEIVIVDTFSYKITAKIFEEVITIVDTAIKTPGRTLSEVVTVVDAYLHTIGKNLIEEVVIVDTMVRSMDRLFSEVVMVVDTVLKGPEKTFAEVITIVDSIISIPGKVLLETVTIADEILRTIGKNLTEAITIVDTFTRSISTTYTETVTVVDTALKTAGRTLTEEIVIVDTFIRDTIARTLTETITIVDTFTRDINRLYTEVITIVDTALNTPGKVLSEEITVVDTFVRNSISRTLSETIIIVDTLTKTTGMLLTEVVTIVDSSLKTSGRMLIESIEIVDNQLKTTGRTLQESVIIVDVGVFSYLYSRTYTEVVSVVDSIIFVNGKFFSETISVVDKYLRKIRWYRKLSTAFRSFLKTNWYDKNNTGYQTEQKTGWYDRNNTDWEE